MRTTARANDGAPVVVSETPNKACRPAGIHGNRIRVLGARLADGEGHPRPLRRLRPCDLLRPLDENETRTPV